MSLTMLEANEQLRELQRRYKEAVGEAKRINDDAKAENRSMTENELKQAEAALERAKELRSQIDDLLSRHPELDPSRLNPRMLTHDPGEDWGYSPRVTHEVGGSRLSFRRLFPDLEDRGSSFRSLADFWQALMSGRHDPRLFEQRQHVAGVGADGGYLVPTQYVAQLLNAILNRSIILSRANVIPLRSLRVEAPAWDDLDQTDGKYYGGFKPVWLGETEEAQEQKAKLRLVTLDAHRVALYTSVSRELAFASEPSVLEQLNEALVESVRLALDEAFLLGDGVKKPKGILTDQNPSLVSVNRAAANRIEYSDLARMMARLHPVAMNGAVWIANPEALEHFLTLKDDSGRFVWQASARDGEPDRLFGKPVFYLDRMPPLGSKGDVLLVNPRFYLAGVGPDVWLDVSEAPHWFKDVTAIRAVMLADGRSGWDKPYTPPNGQPKSWAVVLDIPEA